MQIQKGLLNLWMLFVLKNMVANFFLEMDSPLI